MSPSSSHAGRAGLVLLVCATVLLGAVGVGVLGLERLGGSLGALLERSPACTAQVDGREVTLDADQAAEAAVIGAASVRRGLPSRAAVIGLATAMQESKIRNLDYGDRDSVGVFQQRPSQGWGREARIMDPYYASNRFYAALEQVDRYAELPVAEAAQRVQRSADGSAYAQHAPDARVLASALTGRSPAALTCDVDRPEESAQQPGRSGLTPDALAVRADVRRAYGSLPDGGYARGGVRTGHQEGSAHYDGRAVDFFFRPVGPASNRAGWSLAQFLVARAERLGIATVIYDDSIWTAARSSEGWRQYDVDSDDPVLRHLDHVHVDVA